MKRSKAFICVTKDFIFTYLVYIHICMAGSIIFEWLKLKKINIIVFKNAFLQDTTLSKRNFSVAFTNTSTYFFANRFLVVHVSIFTVS